MEEWVVAYKNKSKGKAVTLRVHPFTAAYLNRRVPNTPTRWFMKHFVRVKVELDETLDPLAYRFLDGKSGKDVTDLGDGQQNGRESGKGREGERENERKKE